MAIERRQAGGTPVGVVVITHRAREELGQCLPPLLRSPLRPRVLVVNSSSQDGTVETAVALGAETLVVPRRSFNHGLTRELARRRLGTPVVVMLTPDAHACADDFLERLTEPVRRGEAAVAYGRQVATSACGLLERVGREFSYPATSHVRAAGNWDRWGSYTRFCSNAAAAWSNAALDRIGGFKPTLVSEETIAVAELLAQGERVAYVAEAVVRHAHRHGPVAAFRRQFDIGYSRRLYDWLLLAREGDAPAELPRITALLAASWLGYRAGLLGHRLPAAMAERLSGQDYFWTSEVHVAGGGALVPV